MNRHRRQEGVALVTAIFLLVVLAALGAYMLTVGGVQRATPTQSLQAARVYFGARAGIDWAIHRAVNAPASMCSSTGVTSTSFALTGAGFTGVGLAVNCSYSTHTDNNVPNGTFNVYYITSMATYGNTGDPEYAERRLEATASNGY